MQLSIIPRSCITRDRINYTVVVRVLCSRIRFKVNIGIKSNEKKNSKPIKYAYKFKTTLRTRSLIGPFEQDNILYNG